MGQQLALFAGAKTNYPNTLPGRPGKRSRKCQLGWPNCSHDTSVGQFLQGTAFYRHSEHFYILKKHTVKRTPFGLFMSLTTVCATLRVLGH